MSTTKKWFFGAVVFGFGAFISGCQIDSYMADKHHFNGIYWVLTIVFGLCAIGCMLKAAQSGGTPRS